MTYLFLLLVLLWVAFNWAAPLTVLQEAQRVGLGRLPAEVIQRANAVHVYFYYAELSRGTALSLWSWPWQAVVLNKQFMLTAHPAQVRFVLAHELGHCALGHLRKRWLAAVCGIALLEAPRRWLTCGDEDAADAYAEALTGLPRAILYQPMSREQIDQVVRALNPSNLPILIHQ